MHRLKSSICLLAILILLVTCTMMANRLRHSEASVVRSKFAEIKEGMSASEVQTVIGRGANTLCVASTGETLIYSFRTCGIWITYDKRDAERTGGVVMSKMLTQPTGTDFSAWTTKFFDPWIEMEKQRQIYEARMKEMTETE